MSRPIIYLGTQPAGGAGTDELGPGTVFTLFTDLSGSITAGYQSETDGSGWVYSVGHVGNVVDGMTIDNIRIVWGAPTSNRGFNVGTIGGDMEQWGTNLTARRGRRR